MKYVIFLAAGLLVLLFAKWAFFPAFHVPRFRVWHTKIRLRLRLHPGRGFAVVPELWLSWSRFASFRESKRARPSLGLWYRLFHPAAHSVFLGRAQYFHQLRLAIQEHLSIFGPPRTGKTGLLAKVVLRYRGAVVNASTKPDIFFLTSGIRSRRGPVYVFNPQRIGGDAVASTIRWDPVSGCADPTVAIRRAQAFAEAVQTGGTETGDSFWTENTTNQLRALLTAAALDGRDFRSVAFWILSGQTEEAEMLLFLNGRIQDAATLAQLRTSKAEKTTATIRMCLYSVISFMRDPTLAECVIPRQGAKFDIAGLLRSEGTLYLIGEQRGQTSPIAPLFAALVTEIHWMATQIGSAMPGGRIDPPVALVLDEVSQICPIPVPSILADSGGRGIQCIIAAHGIAQLRARWKDDGARTVLDTSNQMFLPGILDPDTLEMAAKLAGEATYKDRGKEREKTYSRHAIAPPEVVRQLPRWRGLVIRGSAAPVIARLPMAWRDVHYLRARLTGQAVAPIRALPRMQPSEVLADFELSQLRHEPSPGHDRSPGVDVEPSSDGQGPADLGDEDYPWSA